MCLKYLGNVKLVNPRHACAARDTVVVLCVCLSVCKRGAVRMRKYGTRPDMVRYAVLCHRAIRLLLRCIYAEGFVL